MKEAISICTHCVKMKTFCTSPCVRVQQRDITIWPLRYCVHVYFTKTVGGKVNFTWEKLEVFERGKGLYMDLNWV